MPRSADKKKAGKKYVKPLITAAAAAVIVAAWQIAAETRFKHSGVIPTPAATLALIWRLMRGGAFWDAAGGTLAVSLVSFAVSFAAAAALASLSYLYKGVRTFLRPFIVIARSAPTAAVVLILLLVVGSGFLAASVAFLVVFPLCFENIYSALEGVDRDLLFMARAFNVAKRRVITGVYLPALTPALFSSAVAALGLNIKVVIAAEILGLPSVSVGYMILVARQGLDFALSFAWLAVAVALSLVCECAVRIAGRLCMPYKYPDLSVIKRGLKKARGLFALGGGRGGGNNRGGNAVDNGGGGGETDEI